ncbi:MAG: glycosyltransferase family 4 protein [Magnetococcales bacterium]|nr:glycosyltransferase family 4 protein [Magnetococcales bacterium]
MLHSYSIACRRYCLSMLKRGVFDLRLVEAPPVNWTQRAHDQEVHDTYQDTLGSLEGIRQGEKPDILLRMDTPLRIDPPFQQRTFFFGTSEFCILTAANFAGPFSAERVRNEPLLRVVTPSAWSAKGFEQVGFLKEQIAVVPLGFDPAIFRPDAVSRQATRQRLGIGEDEVVFFLAGNMTPTKGVQFLLPAFARIAAINPRVRLLIKGQDALYESNQKLLKNLSELPAADQQRVRDRLLYFGDNLSDAYMALLFRAADVYVAPYMGEGFAMPVLEAAASGLPSICTQGGPTDEFTDPSYCLRIESTARSIANGIVLEPHVDHLTELMARVAQDPSWRLQAGQRASQDAHNRFTWDKVTDLLIQELL